MKILFIAYACEPNRGSEPGVGWNWAAQAAKFAEVWVITRKNNRDVIERELTSNPIPNFHFAYFDLPAWARFWKRGTRGVHLYYMLWQMGAYLLSRRLHRRYRFDLVHHLTWVNSWMPSLSTFLPLPCIWGPVGNHPTVPGPFRKELSGRERIENLLRALVPHGFSRVDPLVLLARARAVRLIVISKRIAMQLPRSFLSKTIQIPAVGVPSVDPPRLPPAREFTVLFVGRLVGLKGILLAAKAYALFCRRHSGARFVVIGKGPERPRLEKTLREEGVAETVEFIDSVPHSRISHHMAKAGALLFPSFEGGGMVVIEALAAGTPVVCLDFGGPGEFVTSKCGVKVPVTVPDQVVRNLAIGLEKLASDKEFWHRLSRGAQAKIAAEFTWATKGKQLRSIYAEVLAGKSADASAKEVRRVPGGLQSQENGGATTRLDQDLARLIAPLCCREDTILGETGRTLDGEKAAQPTDTKVVSLERPAWCRGLGQGKPWSLLITPFTFLTVGIAERQARRRLAEESLCNLRTYSVLPGFRSPRWLIPMSNRTAILTGLNLYCPYTFIGKALKVTAQFATRIGVGGPYMTNRVIIARRKRHGLHQGRKPNCLVERIEQLLGQKGLAVALARANGSVSKVILQLATHHGEIIAFAKIATDVRAREMVRHEYRVLSKLEANNFSVRLFPETLGFIEDEGVTALVLSPPKNRWRRGPAKLRRQQMDFLFDLHMAEPAEVREGDKVVEWLTNRIHARRLDSSPNWRQRVERSLECLEAMLLRERLSWGLVHGDFAPWNTLLVRGTREHLFVFDWEHCHFGPPTTDLFHFLVQHAALVRGLSPNGIFQELTKAKSPVAQRIREYTTRIGLSRKLLHPLLLLYLLEVSTRYQDECAERPPTRAESILSVWAGLIDQLLELEGPLLVPASP